MIRISEVYKIYQSGPIKVEALKGISLDIAPGEFVAIMGPSGSGKSTLMNIIGCLDRPTRGDCYLEGTRVSKLNDNRLADLRLSKIGFVFQSFNLLPRMSALKNVELPLLYAGKRNNRSQKALEFLARVGLAGRARHKPSELSGGEQQRVAIARALINNPSLILADEPTGNIDSHSANGIMNIFKELNASGVTIVLITHEAEIAAFARRTVLLRDGKIIEDRQNPGKDFTAETQRSQREISYADR